MPDHPPYTDEDVALVARAEFDSDRDDTRLPTWDATIEAVRIGYRESARASLDALVAAGWVRLNPEADIKEFWGALVRYGDAEIVQATGDDRADAERFAANWDPPGRVVRQWAYQWSSPWEQVVAASPSTGEDRTDG